MTEEAAKRIYSAMLGIKRHDPAWTYEYLNALSIEAIDRPIDAPCDRLGWGGASQRSSRVNVGDATGEIAVPPVILRLAELGAELLIRSAIKEPVKES